MRHLVSGLLLLGYLGCAHAPVPEPAPDESGYVSAVRQQAQTRLLPPSGPQKASRPAQLVATLAADGTLTHVTLHRGSGDLAFDLAALDAVRRAAPFPAPPPNAVQKKLLLEIGP